ncbi:MAG TPA: hypothetical protein VJR89_06000 [Polyangiales bacterium]|nr:hypothetical protein [Polyangiales bacterium]
MITTTGLSHIVKEIALLDSLGVPEVFGALQTRMIDTVISTAAALVGLQWHLTLEHVTQHTFGVLINGLVMSDSKPKEPSVVAAKLMYTPELLQPGMHIAATPVAGRVAPEPGSSSIMSHLHWFSKHRCAKPTRRGSAHHPERCQERVALELSTQIRAGRRPSPFQCGS